MERRTKLLIVLGVVLALGLIELVSAVTFPSGSVFFNMKINNCITFASGGTIC